MEIEGAPALVDEPLLLDCAEASVRGVGLLGEQAGCSWGFGHKSLRLDLM